MSNQMHGGFPSIRKETRERVGTNCAAFWLGRSPKTLRNWSSQADGPIRPTRVAGRLAWSVQEIRTLLGVTQ